jgi:thiamine-monophosphate kinase
VSFEAPAEKMKSEFAFIQRIRERAGEDQIGDDTAILQQRSGLETLVTADLLIEEIHFVRRWTQPSWLGHKSLAVSLSDIAAMGGEPRSALITLASPPDADDRFWEEFFDGYLGLANRYGVRLVGGDTSASIDRITIDSIVLGECHQGAAIRRHGARVGDSIFVTGDLGKSSLGLELLRGGDAVVDIDNTALRSHLRPEPRVDFGRELGKRGLAHAMIDVSDGLAQDLGHICRESRVSAVLTADAIPLSDGLKRVADGESAIFEMAITSGEEYELLFTAANSAGAELSTIADSLGVRLTRIGEVVSMSESPVMLERRGQTEALSPRGYDHFDPARGR